MFFPALAHLQAASIEIGSSDHNLIWIADVLDRRDLKAEKLLAFLMSRHLQLDLRTVRAALGAKAVDAVEMTLAHPNADLFLGNQPRPGQKLRAAFACQAALDNLQLALRFVHLYETP